MLTSRVIKCRVPAPWHTGLAVRHQLFEGVQSTTVWRQVYIIEANPRASRTVPFVAKAIGHPLAAYASLLMAGQTLSEIGFTEEPVLNHVAVKEAVLPFEKFQGALLLPGQHTSY